MTKLDRKKKRNEERETVKSFKDFGTTSMVREIKEMDDKKQKQILSKLDDEAASVFKGLLKITATAAETHVPEPAAFDDVREVMVLVRKKDYRNAYRVVKELVGMPNALFKVRSILVRVGHDLASLARHQMGTAELQPGESEAKLVDSINLKLSEVTAYAANDAETMEESDFDVVSQITADLPDEVTTPVIVDGITLLVLPDRNLPTAAQGVRALASGTYLIEAQLVGVPTDVLPEDRERIAQQFAMQQLGASITPIALTRPDSDAVWFPIFKQRFAAEIVHFPDQARRYYGTASAMSEKAAAQSQAKALRLQSVRAEFETANTELLEELREEQAAWDEAHALAKELSEKFLAETGMRWNAKFASIEAHFQKEHEYDLVEAGSDFSKRWQLNRALDQKLESIRERQQRIFEVRATEKAAKLRIVELEKEVAERKTNTLNPYNKLSRRIAATGQQQRA